MSERSQQVGDKQEQAHDRMRFFGHRHRGPGMGIAAEVEPVEDVLGVLRRLWGYLGRYRARLIGVALTSLTYNQHQLYLFGRERTEKWARVLDGADRIRSRYGFGLIRSAKSMPLGREVELATPSLSR